VSCPACGASVPGGHDRCPGCGANVAPVTEGALAPDPALRSRPEPLREIPGLKKKERTWKDEVRERVRDRKRRRAGEGDLPLFRDADDAEASPDDVLEDEPDVLPAPTRSFAREGERGGHASPSDVGLAPSRLELGTDEADLPLRHAAPAPPAAAEVRLAAPEVEPHVRTTERPAREDDDWSLGSEAAAPPRPVERPAYSSERAQAALLDLVLLAALWAIVVYFASRAAHVGLMGLWPAWPYLVGYLAFLGLTYAGYFTGTTGQTLGKIATGLRVVDAGGRPPGYLRAFVRAGLGSLGVLAAGTGLVPMLLDPARRALHDRLVKTRVVKG
jgi:uncharacterized RDD family membrane protein YckC